MARRFVFNTGQYLDRAGVPVSAPPLTLSIWVNMASYAQFAGSLSNTSGNNWFNIGSYGGSPGSTVGYQYDGTNIGTAITSAIPTGVWAHLCAVFTNNGSRSVFLNGAAKVTDTTTVSAITVNRTMVATAYVGGSVFAPNFGGDIAEFAVYNAALTDAEVALLAAGNPASAVRAANLAAYYPLLGTTSPEPDVQGGTGLTLVGSPAAAPHPPILAAYQAGGRMFAVF
jgi:concanavalin A-like lectin/glucanase superfamily protein